VYGEEWSIEQLDHEAECDARPCRYAVVAVVLDIRA
jgi:hypothetical protein